MTLLQLYVVPNKAFSKLDCVAESVNPETYLTLLGLNGKAHKSGHFFITSFGVFLKL